MSYRWKVITDTCESCGEQFEKAAVSLAKQCDPCKKAIAMRSLDNNKREAKEQ
jgi:hypothetical protein